MTTELKPYQPWSYQETLISEASAALRDTPTVLAVMPTGAGKCHPAGTMVLLYNGESKAVEDITTNHQLMGPDSQPRNVLSTNTGYGPIVEIRPHQGQPWRCNDDHILTLVRTPTPTTGDPTVNISVKEYLLKPWYWKHSHQLFHAGPIEFPQATHSGTTRTTTPYMLGIQLSHAEPAAGHTFIPQPYLVSTREDRLELLAGLIDSNGRLDHTWYTYVTKSRQLAQDIAYLARSLGMAAILKPGTADGAACWTISITSPTANIPCRLHHQQAPSKQPEQHPARTAFSIARLGPDRYYGFTLDQDGRYLLDDFTVTHNTITFAEIARRAVQRGNTVSIIVHRQELIKQSAEAVLRQSGIQPGIVWGASREWDKPITIISHGTIQRTTPPPEFRTKILILDEAHHATADGWQHAIELLQPRSLIGFTATPFRQDREPLHPKPFSKIIRPITPQELINLGILCPAVIESPIVTDAATGLPLPPNRASNLPAIYLKAVNHAISQGKSKIILFVSGTQTRTPLQIIDDTCYLLNSRGITAGAIREGMNVSTRQGVVERFKAVPSASVIVNYMALTEGFDAKQVDCIIVGRTTDSESTIIQMIGRGLRHWPSKKDCLVINFTGRSDMEEIIHYWRIDEPKEKQKPAIRDKPLYTAKELSQLSMQFTVALNPVNHEQAAYPWFRPFPSRPLMALSVCGPQGASDTYITIEPDRNDRWNASTVSLHTAGPSPISVTRQSGLDAQQAATFVKRTLGPQAPTIMRSAPWRQRPASAPQVRTYQALTQLPPPEDITSGEASDVIAEQRFTRRNLDKII